MTALAHERPETTSEFAATGSKKGSDTSDQRVLRPAAFDTPWAQTATTAPIKTARA
jgi:hypothetical protein